MKINFQEIKKMLPGIQRNVSLAKWTTFCIGGRAEFFYTAKSKEALIKAVLAAEKIKAPFFVLGGGSKLLVSDEGFKGIVIKLQNTKYKLQNTKIIAEAGVMLGVLVNVSAKTGLSGFEWAAGIPGTVGGALRGNAGAFGGEMKDAVREVETYNIKKESREIFKNKDCCFGYRNSIFKQEKNLVILSAVIELRKGDKGKIKKEIREHLNYRKEKHPLNFPSAGSIFKNVKPKNAREIPAAWLIDKCGLKGRRIGSAKISEKHTNFIVNLGNAKSYDVKKLINLAKRKVKNKFKIELKEEIQAL